MTETRVTRKSFAAKHVSTVSVQLVESYFHAFYAFLCHGAPSSFMLKFVSPVRFIAADTSLFAVYMRQLLRHICSACSRITQFAGVRSLESECVIVICGTNFVSLGLTCTYKIFWCGALTFLKLLPCSFVFFLLQGLCTNEKYQKCNTK